MLRELPKAEADGLPVAVAGPRLLTEQEAAHYLNMPLNSLRAWRARVKHPRAGWATGPAFVRFGRTIRYRVEDLDVYLEKCRVEYIEPDDDAV